MVCAFSTRLNFRFRKIHGEEDSEDVKEIECVLAKFKEVMPHCEKRHMERGRVCNFLQKSTGCILCSKPVEGLKKEK